MGERVLLLVLGTRGDVEPFLALGCSLQDRGHDVVLATHGCYENVVSIRGLEHASLLPGDPCSMMKLFNASPLALEKKPSAFSAPGFGTQARMWWDSKEAYLEHVVAVLDAAWHCAKCFGGTTKLASVIIANPGSLAGFHISEKLNIPFISVNTFPWIPTSQTANYFAMSSANVDEAASNKASHNAFFKAHWQQIKSTVNSWRRRSLNLMNVNHYSQVAHDARLMGHPVPSWCCWSEIAAPKPNDWGDHITICGYFAPHQPLLWSKVQTCDQIDDFGDGGEASQTESAMDASSSMGSPSPSRSSSASADGFALKSPATPLTPPAFRPLSWRPGPALLRFVQGAKKTGERPLYIGFGNVEGDPRFLQGIANAIVRGLHAIACTQGSDNRQGQSGARYVILQPGESFRGLFESAFADEENRMSAIASVSSDVDANQKKYFWGNRKFGEKVSEETAERCWDTLQRRLFYCDEVPHSWLFKRCSCLVHHGGAGTTAQGLRCGVPAVVVPFFGDHFYWGNAVKRLKCGEPVQASSFTAERFQRAVMLSISVKARSDARNVAKRIRVEMDARDRMCNLFDVSVADFKRRLGMNSGGYFCGDDPDAFASAFIHGDSVRADDDDANEAYAEAMRRTRARLAKRDSSGPGNCVVC